MGAIGSRANEEGVELTCGERSEGVCKWLICKKSYLDSGVSEAEGRGLCLEKTAKHFVSKLCF